MAAIFGSFQIASLTVFLALLIGRTVYLKQKSGINVFTIAKGKRGLPWLIEVLFVPFMLAWMAEVMLVSSRIRFRLFPAPFDLKLIDSTVFQTVGVVFLVAAVGLFMAALIAFGNSWRVGIDEDRPGELVRSGIFALSRNPIYVCLDLYFLGTFLVNGTVIFLLFAVVVAAGTHYQILLEERFLRTRYGQAYADYCRTTGRYFGRRTQPAR
jgi:protein-S-isoprenylcysteine O-methyltransferase Ste14